MDTPPLLTLAQLVLGFISVPVVSAVIAAAVKVLLPSTRLAARLQRDLSIYKDLPSSPEKAMFEEHINRTLALYTKRLTPEVRELRATRARRVLGVIGAAAGTMVGIGLVVLGFVLSLNNGTADVFIAAVAGAVATGIALMVSESQRRSARALADRAAVERDAVKRMFAPFHDE